MTRGGPPEPGDLPPKPGDLVWVGAAASVQFAGNRAILVRVIRVHDWPTYHGWRWLDGYVVDREGRAAGRRRVYVQLAGLRRVPIPATRAGPGR